MRTKFAILLFLFILFVTALVLVVWVLFLDKSNSETPTPLAPSPREFILEEAQNPDRPTGGDEVQELTDTIREINAPRGVLTSYDDGQDTLALIDYYGENVELTIDEQSFELTCMDNPMFLPSGESYSLYDSYINIDRYVLRSGNLMFPQERPVAPNNLAEYVEVQTKVVYLTDNTDGIIKGDLDLKIILLDCL